VPCRRAPRDPVGTGLQRVFRARRCSWTERRHLRSSPAPKWHIGGKGQIRDSSITFSLPSCFLILSGFRFKPACHRRRPHPISWGSSSLFAMGPCCFSHLVTIPSIQLYVLRFGKTRTAKGDVLRTEPGKQITCCARNLAADPILTLGERELFHETCTARRNLSRPCGEPGRCRSRALRGRRYKSDTLAEARQIDHILVTPVFSETFQR
jgi:hypothetical protein